MLNERKSKNNILILVMALLLLISSLSLTYFTAHAEGKVYPFDQTNVLDDLESSGTFNVNNYPYSVTENERVINFVEWAYSPFRPEDFALYIYLYNPKKIDWDVNSYSNRIQIATRYKTNPMQLDYDYVITDNSSPVDYETFNIVFCNKSKKQGYEGLFYKFRVIDHVCTDGLTIQERVNSLERRYDISGLVLGKKDGTAQEILIGGTYRFSGYAKGYGANQNSASTLVNKGFTSMETVALEVNATNYRTNSSAAGAYHQYDINSLYFSVPEQYFTKYGNLQKIKLEWYEYKTTPMFMINPNSSDNSLYPTLQKYVGVDLTGKGGEYKAWDSGNDYEIYLNDDYVYTSNGYFNRYDMGYNLPHDAVNLGAPNGYDNNQGVVEEAITEIQWLFHESKVSGRTVKAYIEDYPYAKKGYLPVKNGQISADLFLDTVDEGRTRGYNCVEFDAGEHWDLKSYDDAHSLLQRWCDYGLFTGRNVGIEVNDVAPIVCDIKESEITSSNLLINSDDVVTFKDFYKTAKENNERTVLFRFAVTDYWYEGFSTTSAVIPNATKGDLGALSQQTVFLDTKIIHLTFQTKDKYTVIPVVQDPVDVINGVTEFPDNDNWWDNLLGVLGAWGVLILGIVGTIFLIFLIIKIIGALMPGGIIAKIIMLLLVVGLIVLGVFFVDWVFDTIISLGGLTW